MTRPILGSKGGGGASFITKPDSLRSNDSFEILLGLGSGRWKGLTNGLGSLKINGVPMENEDGTSNFDDVHAIFADGNPLEDQLVTFRLGGGGQTQAINTALANLNASGPGPWVSGAVSTLNANFIDMRFVVQQLFYQDEKSIRENTATIEIEMRPSGTSEWINPFIGTASSTVEYNPDGFEDVGAFGKMVIYIGRSMFNNNGFGFKASNNPNLVIKGKTNSPFVKELRIAVPNEGVYANKTWEVRARLLEKDTVDSDKIQQRRLLTFESITAVIKAPLGDHADWDGQVWMQIYGKASNQFSGFPEIEGTFDTKICRTPPTTVFNPDTRAYSGLTWDGSYEEHFTTDPAWQIKEFVEDPIHGLAGLQPGSTLDKWDALEASKYYSELVPDGRGGMHPRFNLNLTINEAREVEEMMGFLAGSVNSYTEDVGGGVWRLKVDKPETPVMLFTEDNIFGEFNYSHTDVDSRFNDWRGTFLNEDLDYQTDTVRVHDQADIDTNGMRFTEIALVGCTNEQEALRRLMFRLRVSLNEYKIVTFSTNRVGRYISPLSTILVADAALNTEELVKSTSRLASTGGTIATLLRPVRLEVGINYVMHFTTSDQQTVTRTVMNAAGARGDQTEIYLNAALPANVMPESAVALEAPGLGANPLSYRVIGVERSEEDEDQYTITASIIDSGKWDAMDNVSQEALSAQISKIEIDSPTVPVSGMFDVVSYATDFDVKQALQVNWDRPSGSYLEGYEVEYRINDGPWKRLADVLRDSYMELINPEAGVYDFRITALDRRGVKSNPLVGRYELTQDRLTTAPTHLRGTLANRPDTGPYEGFRYTVTDAAVPTTMVWEDGQWKSETNLVTQGTDIGVENGATVGMTPAEETRLADTEFDLANKTVQIDSILVDVGDLQTTYGSVASAADSAAAAADSASIAQASEAVVVQAETNAQQAATDAAAASSAAQAAQTAAQGAQTAAETAQDDAIAKANEAAGSATTAAGSATTATNKANEAAGSASSASGSASTATTKAGEASTSAGQAATSASNASGSASAASTSATNAASSRDAAAGSASAASTSASTAGTHATNAGTSASAANTSANTATTKAGEASTSASNAATSATNASGSANSASSSATVAASSSSAAGQAASAAGTRTMLAESFSSNYSYVTPGAFTGVVSAGVLTDTSGQNGWGYGIVTRASTPLVPGKTIRVTAQVKSVSASPANYACLAISRYDVDGAYLGLSTLTSWVALSTTTPQTLTGDFLTDGQPVTTAFYRVSVLYNRDATGGVISNSTQVYSLYEEDVTSELAANTSASAAATSASTASTKASEAGTSASAANTSATNASTSAGNASTSATNAATSATNASGSANSASASMSVASALSSTVGLTPNAHFDKGTEQVWRGYSYNNANKSEPFLADTGLGLNANYQGRANVIVNATGTMKIVGMNQVPIDPSRTYRIKAGVYSSGGADKIYVGMRIFAADGTFIGNLYGTVAAATGVTGWRDASGEYSTTEPPATNKLPANVAFGIPFAFLNYDNAAVTSALDYLYIEDITSEKNAAGSATAAATSASTASTKAGEASTSASAANTSATNAATSAGNASTSATNASTSETNAAGSANSASSSASVASTASNTARLASLVSIPSRTDRLDDWANGIVDVRAPLGQSEPTGTTVVSDADLGPALENSGSGFLRAPLPVVPGRKYRIKASMKFLNSASSRVRLMVYHRDADNVNLASPNYYASSMVAANVVSTIDQLLDCDAILAAYPTTGSLVLRFLSADTSNPLMRLGRVSVENVTVSELAAGSASAAATSASTAGTHATNAGTSASAASTSATNASTSAGNASTSATNAATSASSASSSAAAALSQATLAASLSFGALNSNPTFATWTSGLPTNVTKTAGLTVTQLSGGMFGSPYRMRAGSPAGANNYFNFGTVQEFLPGTYVLEVDAELAAGSWLGAGVYVYYYDSAGTYITTSVLNMNLTTDMVRSLGNKRSWATLITAPAGTASVLIRPHNNNTTLGDVAKTIDWFRVSLRPATAAEIIEGTAGPALRASVNQMAGALAAASGRTTAYWQVETNAGSDAAAFITAKAETSTPAQAPITYITGNTAYANGRTLGKTGAAGWGDGIASTETYTGSAYMSVQPLNAGTNAGMIGLTDHTTAPGTYTQLDYAWYWSGTGAWYFYESGGNMGSFTGYVTDTATIEYSGTTVTYKINGRVKRTVTTTAGRTFRFGASIYTAGDQWRNLVFSGAAPAVSSSVAIGASEFAIYNPVGTGEWKQALTLANGNAIFTGGLQVGAYIRLGNGDGWPVALKPRNFQVADGDVVSFGTTLDGLPTLIWQKNNLAALTSGETYNVYAENLTATGFTARVKIAVPASPSNYSLTTSTAPGTGPTRQIDKSANPVATDGNYTLSYGGTCSMLGRMQGQF